MTNQTEDRVSTMEGIHSHLALFDVCRFKYELHQ